MRTRALANRYVVDQRPPGARVVADTSRPVDLKGNGLREDSNGLSTLKAKACSVRFVSCMTNVPIIVSPGIKLHALDLGFKVLCPMKTVLLIVTVKLELAAAETRDITDAIRLPEVPARGMEQAFSSLYFLVKQRIPHTTNYEPLLDFLGFLGIDVKADIHVAKNATYTSVKAIQEILSIMSEVVELKF